MSRGLYSRVTDTVLSQLEQTSDGIWVCPWHRATGGLPVNGLAHDLDVVVHLEESAHTAAHHHVVVHQENPDRRRVDRPARIGVTHTSGRPPSSRRSSCRKR